MARMKEIATDIMEASMVTGYDFDFLCRMVDDLVEDGETMQDAAEEVIGIAYEFDY